MAGNIRRAATKAGLDAKQRAGADTCATYLTNKRAYLDYPTALANGWPIATGVIEGACRHLVKDRLDITGARWGLPGAEAVLKLRAIVSNGDFDEYWRFHLALITPVCGPISPPMGPHAVKEAGPHATPNDATRA